MIDLEMKLGAMKDYEVENQSWYCLLVSQISFHHRSDLGEEKQHEVSCSRNCFREGNESNKSLGQGDTSRDLH